MTVETKHPVPPPKPKPKRNLTATLREWHKRAGLAAFLFIIWLAASGVLLTRSNELGFDAVRVDWPWLMSLYGLHAEPPQVGFSAGGHWLTSTSEFTIIDTKPLAEGIAGVVGIAAGNDPAHPMLFVAAADSLVLLTPEGERVDELRAPILPISSIRRIGIVNGPRGNIAIQDFDAYQSGDGGETWKPVAPADVRWSSPVSLPEDLRAQITPYARPRVIVEQLLIDLHTGRLFGPVGAWIITIIGFAALWLAGSGVWMWWRIKQNRQRQTQLR